MYTRRAVSSSNDIFHIWIKRKDCWEASFWHGPVGIASFLETIRCPTLWLFQQDQPSRGRRTVDCRLRAVLSCLGWEHWQICRSAWQRRTPRWWGRKLRPPRSRIFPSSLAACSSSNTLSLPFSFPEEFSRLKKNDKGSYWWLSLPWHLSGLEKKWRCLSVAVSSGQQQAMSEIAWKVHFF